MGKGFVEGGWGQRVSIGTPHSESVWGGGGGGAKEEMKLEDRAMSSDRLEVEPRSGVWLLNPVVSAPSEPTRTPDCYSCHVRRMGQIA